MAADLFVVARVDPSQPWGIVGGPMTAADAATVVQTTLADRPTARVVVVRALQSFRATVIPAQDPSPVLDA